MKTLPDESVDAVLCDPPYNLAFMGKKWDTHINNAAYQEWTREWAIEAFRVLKPGGHLLAFGGTRTYHRQTCGIEDAGFEIRDCISWIYSQGFPKSLNVSVAIDKAAGAKRSIIGAGRWAGREGTPTSTEDWGLRNEKPRQNTAPATTEAEQWEGWGTALKPAMEPIVVARKPFKGTVAANVLKHRTGALNIDASRITSEDNLSGGAYAKKGTPRDDGWKGMQRGGGGEYRQPSGRWPANILFDEDAAAVLDEQSGQSKSSKSSKSRQGAGGVFAGGLVSPDNTHGDSGGASRFFYVAKASKSERNAGLEALPSGLSGAINGRRDGSFGEPLTAKNTHPCVKPITLLRYLSTLICPPGGTILDSFMGSGSGGCAAVLEGFNYIGIEMEPEYLTIARARIEHWAKSAGVEIAAS